MNFIGARSGFSGIRSGSTFSRMTDPDTGFCFGGGSIPKSTKASCVQNIDRTNVRKLIILWRGNYFANGNFCFLIAVYDETKLGFFFFIWASAIKSWKKSRIFRYRLPEDFLSKANTTGGGASRVDTW